VPEPAYPFLPRSTRWLKRGHFWAIPLGCELYGAGCVVGSSLRDGKRDTRLFIAGVVQWTGSQPPTSAELFGRPLVDFAFAHLKAITEDGGLVIGQAAIRFADAPVAAEGLSMSTWGFRVPRIIALRFHENDD
jgi:hypothetical protein